MMNKYDPFCVRIIEAIDQTDATILSQISHADDVNYEALMLSHIRFINIVLDEYEEIFPRHVNDIIIDKMTNEIKKGKGVYEYASDMTEKRHYPNTKNGIYNVFTKDQHSDFLSHEPLRHFLWYNHDMIKFIKRYARGERKYKLDDEALNGLISERIKNLSIFWYENKLETLYPQSFEIELLDTLCLLIGQEWGFLEQGGYFNPPIEVSKITQPSAATAITSY